MKKVTIAFAALLLTPRGQYLFVSSQIDSGEYDPDEYANVYVNAEE